MTKQDWDDKITNDVYSDFTKRGLKRISFKDAEYYKMMYEMALEKLEEQSKKLSEEK